MLGSGFIADGVRFTHNGLDDLRERGDVVAIQELCSHKRPTSRAVFWAVFAAVSAMLCAGCATGREPALSHCVAAGWPIISSHPAISSPFGYRSDPFTGERRFHAGVDIPARRKSPVYATAAGKVVAAGRASGRYGKCVVIDHGGGYETRYAHLARVKTKPGKRVKRGQVIGAVGRTGRATGFHLHYEVRRNGQAIDPTPYLAGQPGIDTVRKTP